MTRYKYDLESMETIFSEIAIALQDNQDSSDVFTGGRETSVQFATAITSEMNEIAHVVINGKEMPYEAVILALSMGVEWLIWMRQNGVLDEILGKG